MRRIIRQRFGVSRRLVGRIVSPRPISLHITLSVEAVRKLAEQLPQPIAETRGHNVRPTLRRWVEVIDQILKEDAPLPKRVRTSAMQIFQKLRKQHGYTGCYNVVQEYVRQARNPAQPELKVLRRSAKAQEASTAKTSPPVEQLIRTAPTSAAPQSPPLPQR